MRPLAALFAIVAMSATPATADIFIPTGDAILHLADDGSKIARIEGVDNVHGLAVAPRAGLVVAGSLSQRMASNTGIKADETEMSGRRTLEGSTVTEDEHDAHHGAFEAGKTATVSTVTIYDLASHKPVRKIDVGGMVHHVAVDDSETYAIVTHPGLGGVSIITIGHGEVRGPIATGPNPEYAVADPRTGRFFVSNAGNGTISDVDPKAGIVKRNFPLTTGPKHLQLLPEQRILVVAEADAGFASLLDADSGEQIDRFEIGGALHGIQADVNALYVSAHKRDRVIRIDLATGERTESAVQIKPYHMTLAPNGLLVSSSAEDVVKLLDRSTLDSKADIVPDGIAHQIVVAPNL